MKKIIGIILIGISIITLTGCGAKFDSSKQISVVTREDGSGTKSAFMELIGLKDKADISGVIVATSTQAVLTEVKTNPLAIAYDSLGYVTDEVKVLKVEGVEATKENIKNNSYKISRPLSIVYRESNMEGLNESFLEFLKSTEAQEIISNNGYVTTIDETENYKVSGINGEITITGSTSLKPLMEKLAAKFEELESDASVSVGGGGSGTGYNDAENNVSDFGMISEEFNETKASSCTSYVVALDGIAIIVNRSNPLENITIEELKNIYDVDATSEKISKWNQIIGE